MKHILLLFIFITSFSYSQTVVTTICYFEEPIEKTTVVQADFNISPSIVTAGTHTIVTISGSGFGSEVGRLKWGGGFASANWMFELWTDTKIIARVPFYAYSGEVQVQLADQTPIGNTNKLDVRYGVVQKTGPVGDSYDWFNPASYNHNNEGGMTWHCPTGTPQNFKDDIAEALLEWRNATGINWQLGEDIDPSLTKFDGYFIAKLGNSPGAAHSSQVYEDCGVNQWAHEGGEVVFDERKDYKAMLHEIGHAMGLQHNTYASSVMNQGANQGSLQSIDIEAGLYVKGINCQGVLCRSNMEMEGCALSIFDNLKYLGRLIKTRYVDILGKKHDDLEYLSSGFYIEEKEYENNVFIRTKEIRK